MRKPWLAALSVLLLGLCLACGDGRGVVPAFQRAALEGEGSFGCLPLPHPTGVVTHVTPAEASQLAAILASAAPDQTIVLADGTYTWSALGLAAEPLKIFAPGVTLRSASGNAAAVVLDGEYATGQLLWVHASDVTVTDLTFTRSINSAIHVKPSAAPTIRGARFHRLRFLDVGGFGVDGLGLPAEDAWADDGVVECSRFEQSDEGRLVANTKPICQIGAVRVAGSRDWRIRLNQMTGLFCDTGIAPPAIFAWLGARDTVVENNILRDCDRAIGFGLGQTGSLRTYPDDPYPTLSPNIDHYGGLARNNFISGADGRLETGIASENGRDVRVFHNTIYVAPPATGFYASLDNRFPNSRMEIRNNIAQNLSQRDGPTPADLSGNLFGATAALFVDADGPTQDLHLTASALAAIDQGGVLSEGGEDIDGSLRLDGMPDIGADELGASRPLFTTTPSGAARCGIPYAYLPVVTGVGPLTFSLASATGSPIPSGLTLDPSTGAIHWFPTNQQTGLFELDLRVDGPTGMDAQRLAIDVDCTPPPRMGIACACGAVDPAGAVPLWLLLFAAARARRRRFTNGHSDCHRRRI